MDVGVHCPLPSCLTLTFLPISCPYCRQKFCESHFLPTQHACTAPGSSAKHLSDSELIRLVARANPGRDRTPCQLRGCKGKSLQVGQQCMGISVAEGSSAGVSHAAPRCERCGGLFCMKHRSALSHKCSAPAPITQGQARIQAAEARKKRAQEVLAKNFPGRSVRGEAKDVGGTAKAQGATSTLENDAKGAKGTDQVEGTISEEAKVSIPPSERSEELGTKVAMRDSEDSDATPSER